MRIALFIVLFSSLCVCAQDGPKTKIGTSSCSCDSLQRDSIVTLKRWFHANGTRKIDTVLQIGDNCKIGDTLITLYDTLGRAIQHMQPRYAWNRRYDTNSNVIRETIYFGDDTISRTVKQIEINGNLRTAAVYEEGDLLSQTTYKGRKGKTINTRNVKTDIYRYSKDNKLLKYSSKTKNEDGTTRRIVVKNKYNTSGQIIKSSQHTNGKIYLVVQTEYENERDVKEVRTYPESNTVIQTFYTLALSSSKNSSK